MRRCPHCNREMDVRTDRVSEDSWQCTYCSLWSTVCDHCLSPKCWAGTLKCPNSAAQGSTLTIKGVSDAN